MKRIPLWYGGAWKPFRQMHLLLLSPLLSYFNQVSSWQSSQLFPNQQPKKLKTKSWKQSPIIKFFWSWSKIYIMANKVDDAKINAWVLGCISNVFIQLYICSWIDYCIAFILPMQWMNCISLCWWFSEPGQLCELVRCILGWVNDGSCHSGAPPLAAPAPDCAPDTTWKLSPTIPFRSSIILDVCQPPVTQGCHNRWNPWQGYVTVVHHH